MSWRNGNHSRASDTNWLTHIRRYLLLVLVMNLAWETAHLPLYTVWTERSDMELVWAVIHCTGGDVLIATTTLVFSLVLVGGNAWPKSHFWRVGLLTIASGVVYAIFSEWLNIVVRKSWAYSPAMPIVPLVRTGLSPLAQWLLVPAAALYLSRRSLS